MSLSDTAKLLASLDLDNRKFNAAATQSMGKLNQLGVKGVAIGTALGTGLEHLAEAGLRKLGGAHHRRHQQTSPCSRARRPRLPARSSRWASPGKLTADQVAGWAPADRDGDRLGVRRQGHHAGRHDAHPVRQDHPAEPRTGHAGDDRPRHQDGFGGQRGARSWRRRSPILRRRPGKLARSGVVLTKSQQDTDQGDGQGRQDTAGRRSSCSTSCRRPRRAPRQRRSARTPTRRRSSPTSTEDAQKALATGFLPVIERVRDILSKELAKPSTLANIKAFGQALATGLDKLVTFVQGLDWKAIGSGLETAGKGAKAIFDAFMGLPAETKGLLLGFVGLNKLTGGAPVKIAVDFAKDVGGGLFGAVPRQAAPRRTRCGCRRRRRAGGSVAEQWRRRGGGRGRRAGGGLVAVRIIAATRQCASRCADRDTRDRGAPRLAPMRHRRPVRQRTSRYRM